MMNEVVQRVVGEQEVLGGVEGVGRRHRDAHRLRGTGGSMLSMKRIGRPPPPAAL